MNKNNILQCKNRHEFRQWLMEHHDGETECWVEVRRGRPDDESVFWYLDAVEEALCFGWIDSTHRLIEGRRMQRFTPRKKNVFVKPKKQSEARFNSALARKGRMKSNSPWTELNKERVRRLERLDMMTDAGRRVLPPMGQRSFKFDPDIVAAMKSACCWTKFRQFPPLYQRIRAYNIAFYKQRDRAMYEQTLAHLIEETKKGRMFGEWNDYGRL